MAPVRRTSRHDSKSALSSNHSQRSASLPKTPDFSNFDSLGPFAVIEARWDSGDIQLMEDGEESTKWSIHANARTWEQSGNLQTLKKVVKMWPIEGRMGVRQPIATLPPAQRKNFLAPSDATAFGWSYPTTIHFEGGSKEALAKVAGSGDPNALWVLRGGFVFWNSNDEICGMTTIAPTTNKEEGLLFGEPQQWKYEWTGALKSRFKAVTIQDLLDKGAHYFCWVRPQEPALEKMDPSLPRYGGFVYLFHEQVAVHDKEAAFSDRIFPLVEVRKSTPVVGQAFQTTSDLESQYAKSARYGLPTKNTPMPDLAPKMCWQRLDYTAAACAPLGRRKHGAVAYKDRFGSERFVVLGGECESKPRDTEMVSLQMKESPAAQKSLGSPPEWKAEWAIMRSEFPKRLQSFSVCALGGSIVIFGGLEIDTEKVSSSVYVFNTEVGAWQNMHDATQKEDWPEPRFEHAAASLEGDRRMIVHGGRLNSEPKSVSLSNVFCLEVGQRTLRWTRIRLKGAAGDRGGLGGGVGVRTLPLPRRRAQSLCLAGDMSRAYVFGGCADGETASVSADLSVIVLDKCTTLTVEVDNSRGQAPEPRAYHTAVLLGQFMAIFGGMNRRGDPFNDLHLLHLPSMIWTCPELGNVPRGMPHWPEARYSHAAVAMCRTQVPAGEGVREGMIIFRGQGRDEMYDDAWGLYFEPPEESSAPTRCMAEALGAFSDQILSSLRERFLLNIGLLRGEHANHFEDLKSQVEQSQQEVKACAGILNEAQNCSFRAKKDQEVSEQREEQVKEQLVEQQEEAQIASEDAVEELEEAENEIARLKAVLKRLEGSQNIFTAGKLLNYEDVEICRDDVGIEQSNTCTPLGIVNRSSGFWRGSLVTIENIRMEGFDGILEKIDPNVRRGSFTAMHNRVQAAEKKKQRKRWESATRQELHIISRLRHPCLLEYYGAAFDGEELLLVSEPPLVPLSHRLVEAPPLSEMEKLDVAIDLSHALEYLHARGITHRHITEENVFLKDLPHVAVKLGGLLPARLSCRATGAVFVPSSYEPPPPGQSILVPTQDEAKDPRKADIFGFGALMMHLYSGHKPEPGKALRSMVQILDRIEDQSIQMVVMRCMEKDPAHRPSARMTLKALTAVADGEVAGMEPLADDPSMQSALADNTCALDDDEY